MSSVGPRKPRQSIAELRAAAKKAGGLVPEVQIKEPVHVPQGEAAMLPRRLADEGLRYIATKGLGPCVGVIVVGGTNVGLAHIDSDSVGIAANLASFAMATIPDVVKIYISSGTPLPQPGSGGDRSPTQIFNGLKQHFRSDILTVLNYSDIGCDVVTGEIILPMYAVPATRMAGIPYWNVKRIPPELIQPLAR